MKEPIGAKLEVIVTIDPDLWDEMKSQGMSDEDIEKAIKNALTLKEPAISKPITDIDSVVLLKCYLRGE